MKILVVGGGGREHALAWKLAQSERCTEVLVAPGNAGTAREDKCHNVPVSAENIDALLDLARRESVAFTVVGPEAPLAAGIADRFAEADLRCFGPQQAAAQLEASKAFAKEFCTRHHIPTAAWAVFTDLDDAKSYVRRIGLPAVIKADGLAAGKGVVIARTLAQADATLADMLSGSVLDGAGSRVVIEEFLEGEEASFIVVASGRQFVEFASSQDHKAAHDGDTGPNTGGMGAYSPAPVVDEAVRRRVLDEIIRPTLDGLASDGLPYCGFLYAGLMIDGDGHAKVLEYNCRMGDPETQPLLMRLESDLVDLIDAALDGRLAAHEPRWDPRPCLGVVMAAGGYPGNYDKGLPIRGLDADFGDDVKVFHAGTAERDGQVVTNGGRVLCVCAKGDTVAEAKARAYAAVARIEWDGEYHRSDIGYRAVAREAGR